MKKITLSILALIACTASLFAQITREQADEIVINYLKSEQTQPYVLYVNANTPSEEGFVITTSNGETIKAKYACWVYCEFPTITLPGPIPMGTPPFRYLFIKKDSGSLLEIITNNNLGYDLSSWTEIKVPTGITEPKENLKSLYPNPVNDLLTLPVNGKNIRVEIYDLKGSRLFCELLSGEGACHLNVSFLNPGIYMVNVSGKTYKIIKN